MEIRTRPALLANIAQRARSHPVVFRVVLKLLPPMTLIAVIFIGTAVLVLGDKIVWFPRLARHWLVIVNVRFPSVVLPVMRVNTLSSVVLNVVERAPHSLVVEDVEIVV